MGKGPAWSQIFFNSFLVGVALNQYVSVKAISSQIEILHMDCIIAVYN